MGEGLGCRVNGGCIVARLLVDGRSFLMSASMSATATKTSILPPGRLLATVS